MKLDNTCRKSEYIYISNVNYKIYIKKNCKVIQFKFFFLYLIFNQICIFYCKNYLNIFIKLHIIILFMVKNFTFFLHVYIYFFLLKMNFHMVLFYIRAYYLGAKCY